MRTVSAADVEVSDGLIVQADRPNAVRGKVVGFLAPRRPPGTGGTINQHLVRLPYLGMAADAVASTRNFRSSARDDFTNALTAEIQGPQRMLVDYLNARRPVDRPGTTSSSK